MSNFNAMSIQKPFKVSTHLKDIIGRDLVTNEFVAIFELVKNSVDAGANLIQIEIDPNANLMRIVDDGKGMGIDDIIGKWLFVAYSAKADDSEDLDYRDKIKLPGGYAGSKGIGRFSCDTLGKKLRLYSKNNDKLQKAFSLSVDWSKFERDSKEEFKDVFVDLNEDDKFPPLKMATTPAGSGTILQIEELRHEWDDENVRRLRSYLAKLIDPFGTTKSVKVVTYLVNSNPHDEKLNGPVGNDIADILREKTSRINVSISKHKIISELIDRGKLIYKISEPNFYPELQRCNISGEVFFLNRSAKSTFRHRMKVTSVEFGSVFLFLNGFRVFPVGEETDDTLGLNRRKQQGTSRYLGTRDILGRIDVQAPQKMFREASSRDAGLIEDANSRALFEAIKQKMIYRLERYVVGVNWKDKVDQGRDTPVGLEGDPAKARILQIVGGLARTKNIEILDFDQNILDLADAREAATEKTLTDLIAIAERDGDSDLLKRIEQTRARIAQLEKAESDARREANRLAYERAQSDARIIQLEKQSRYLAASQNLDAERIQLLLHQVNIYSGHIGSSTTRGLGGAQQILKALSDTDDMQPEEFELLSGALRNSVRTLMDDFSYIRLENNRLQTISRFAPNIKVNLETSHIQGDLIEYLSEYFSVMLADTGRAPKVHFQTKIDSLKSEFSPFDIAVVVDNLIDNARKANALNIWFVAKAPQNKGKLELHVSDDGQGFDLDRIERDCVFDKHYTGTHNGTGLGLFHVAHVLEEMGGSIKFDPKSDITRADFIITIPENTK
ncbi:histidine kinase [Acetobacter indonesiensis NRIC 0313]|uniref:histidine kinase n=1 Tax=Acetobacter indonesiensis TaxID=104101 RepID=A0A6N3T5L9_9PROT|nr:ATP-binding protein [Acetobacter indonesiensis]GAN62657.1 histidine kinase [Acetobacter indonesiensis]GBQ62093.1 histidine kinase [Acetobacter indonesiensis NRIC 0313]GEN04586.1 histidine kinase [Acetobacter indonesiensis]